MYEGEWVDDTAKCGVYQDIPASSFADEESQCDFLAQNASSAFQLQRLGLVNTEEVLTEAVANVRRKRAAEAQKRSKSLVVSSLKMKSSTRCICCRGSRPYGQDPIPRFKDSSRKFRNGTHGRRYCCFDDGIRTNMYTVSFAEFTGVLARLKI